MATLTLIEGPAGGGKSQLAADLLDAGAVEAVADVTALWAALAGARRGPDGRFPERSDADPALHVARYVQPAAARVCLDSGHDVAVTTSRRGQAERWRALATAAGAEFAVRTVDPGVEVVIARLSTDRPRREESRARGGYFSRSCFLAVSRWYPRGEVKTAAAALGMLGTWRALADDGEDDPE